MNREVHVRFCERVRGRFPCATRLREGDRQVFEVIEAEKAAYPIRLMCRVLEVSVSGYYAWRARERSSHAQQDEVLEEKIERIHQESRGTYGSPRVHRALREEGHRTSRKRVARIMRQSGLKGRERKRFVRTTDSNHPHPIAPNLVNRCFTVDRPDKCWVGDITYLWTGEGWLYLAVLLDLYSRRVVGWSMADHMRAELPLAALEMALGHRNAEGVVHHTDRGSQYASHRYRAKLESHGLVASMSRKGDCWDNAVPESFFSTLKLELVYRSGWATREEARADVYEYLEVFYNRKRIHSSAGYCSPVTAEQQFYAGLEEAFEGKNLI